MAMDECFRSPFFMLKHPSPFMDRAVVPVTVGLAASLHLWLRFLVFEKGPELVVNSLVRAGHHWLWGSWSSDIHLDIDWFTILNCGTCLILYFSRHELLDLGRALVGALRLILRVVGVLIQVLSGWLSYFHQWLDGSHIVAQASTQTAERDRTLTWSVMAVVGAGGPVLPPGSFALISRPPEWDEVIVLAYADGGQVGICKTTSTDGVDWIWTLVNMVGMFIRLPLIQADGSHQAPAGVVHGDVNWICTPPAGAAMWVPSVAEVANGTAEANLILQQYQAGATGWVVNQPGVAGALVPLTPVGGGPIGPGGGGGAALAGPQPGAAGLGIVPPGDAGQNQVDLRQLESAVQQLQAMALSPSNSQRSKKKKTKSDKKDKRHKKSKKKKKGSGSSSSSDSSSNRSRSRSSSSSSSNGKKKPLRWKADGTDKKVTYSDLSHVDGLKFKKRGDLVAFAARHPGALTAHFLASVYQRLSKSQLTRSSQLRDVSVTAWAHQFSGLTEVRDVKEVLTLAEILDAVNRKEISQALDVLCQRILAIQSAKQKGGSWERAEAIELVDNRRTLASSSMLALTNN